jgi:LacI family transcriptional regulator
MPPQDIPSKVVRVSRSSVTHRVAIVHTKDTLEAWDFCRGVASYRPRSGIWGLRSIPIKRETSQSYLRQLGDTICDGLIMMPARSGTLRPLYDRGVKVVGVDGDWDRASYPCIRLDDHYIGQLAGEHLLERGFERFVFLGATAGWSRERASGLQQVVLNARRECHLVFFKDWMQIHTDTWINKQLRRIARPFAVMGCDDLVAARIVRAVNTAGWQIPTEVAVIGVDDRITECIGVHPPLSSISMERFRIGHEAAVLLDRSFMGKVDTREVRRFRPMGVTERESTSTYVCDDADIAAAISYIHHEACNGITIDDVVRNVNLARRTLERRFTRFVGRPPGDEIRRVRIDAVKQAIERTHLPLADVAAQCGFSSISSLSHSFRLATGMSPDAYRQKIRADKTTQLREMA